MKRTLFILITSFTLSTAHSQRLTKPELDSLKGRIQFISQSIASFKCITQGQAQDVQTELGNLFQTILRKEKEDTTGVKPKK